MMLDDFANKTQGDEKEKLKQLTTKFVSSSRKRIGMKTSPVNRRKQHPIYEYNYDINHLKDLIHCFL